MLFLLLFLSMSVLVAGQSNLPLVLPGGFTVSTAVRINATVEAVWRTVIDFDSYKTWNPFVREAIIFDNRGIKLPVSQQFPRVGDPVRFRVQIPPLPLPITRRTRDVYANNQISNEHITFYDDQKHQVAWKADSWNSVLYGERWSAVSATPEGETLYESREVFTGPAENFLRWYMGSDVQRGFDAQAQATKERCEV